MEKRQGFFVCLFEQHFLRILSAMHLEANHVPVGKLRFTPVAEILYHATIVHRLISLIISAVTLTTRDTMDIKNDNSDNVISIHTPKSPKCSSMSSWVILSISGHAYISHSESAPVPHLDTIS